MFPYSGETDCVPHGGDLNAARLLFPGAPEPFIDLSTGINPDPYPLPRLPGELFARLPDWAANNALAAAAARAYGALSPDHVVAAPGTQILLPLVAGLLPPTRAAIVTPTYGEFTRAAAFAGHSVAEVHEIGALGKVGLVILANPNNPDGRLFGNASLIALGKNLGRHGGLLVVDEAFMDVGSLSESLVPEVSSGNIIVLRSFGKFFGLAGLRLGFAFGAHPLAARLAAALGPWAVSGPALAVGVKALADRPWIERTRSRLAKAARRLDAVLTESGLEIVGGTALFRLVRTRRARDLFDHLGRAGILVRLFPDNGLWVRFGLPRTVRDWRRLQIAMAAFRDKS
jgi:cobalamin biosynthesis protein CobC